MNQKNKEGREFVVFGNFEVALKLFIRYLKKKGILKFHTETIGDLSKVAAEAGITESELRAFCDDLLDAQVDSVFGLSTVG